MSLWGLKGVFPLKLKAFYKIYKLYYCKKMTCYEADVNCYEADELVVEYLAAMTKKNELNGGTSIPSYDNPKKPRFIYIKKCKSNKKPLGKFHALHQSIKNNRYYDIIYYVTELLYNEVVDAEELIKVLCDYYKVPCMEVLMGRVYATLYNDAAFMHRLKGDSVLNGLARSETSTLEETIKYIKSQLTAEEMQYFTGDSLTEEEFTQNKKAAVQKSPQAKVFTL